MKSLALFVAAVAGAAVAGSQFRPGAWYAALEKPAWTPPDWLFAPVWTALYVAIAVAGWLVWRGGASPRRSAALGFWVAQLLLNALWSWLFFGLHRPGLALVEIAALWLAILGFALAAWPVKRLATVLFVPYALWVGYAAALNLALWRLNPATP
jgi:tryptophan-rich sensory protein